MVHRVGRKWPLIFTITQPGLFAGNAANYSTLLSSTLVFQCLLAPKVLMTSTLLRRFTKKPRIQDQSFIHLLFSKLSFVFYRPLRPLPDFSCVLQKEGKNSMSTQKTAAISPTAKRNSSNSLACAGSISSSASLSPLIFYFWGRQSIIHQNDLSKYTSD